ncbi:MAG TPA: molybdopterin-dependent oxidoreductase [Ferruginibacter sp.]|nr:molybdopterin-dependent oxidoreductase [Ferruginibacter sp.]
MNDEEKIVTDAQVRNKTLLSMLFLLVFFAGAVTGWKWLHKQPKDEGAPRPLRNALIANELIFENIFSNNHTAKTFSKKSAVPRVRVNGDAGMSEDFDPSSWKLEVIRNVNDTLRLSLDEIKALPKTEIIFDFKCIEGWSQVTHWGGVRFSDFVKKYGLDEQAKLQFTGLVTPDMEYYVGIDTKSMMHPQTLLCYEMNGAPLPMNQGYPLRLIIPVKYGVKHIKRIGSLFFSSQRPKDYWYERGYDYYCGL